MDQLLNFIVMFVPAGLVLAHSLVEVRHRQQQIEDLRKHQMWMMGFFRDEVLKHLRTQDDVITNLQRKLDA